MVLLESSALPLGTNCPDFTLPAVHGLTYSVNDFSKSKALLVVFMCNHCPYVRSVEDRLISLRHSFSRDELAMVGICSNDAQRYPDDSPEEIRDRWLTKSYGFPYLIDEAQAVAKAFGAVCTPDLFLFDQERRLFYHGRLDDNWQHEDKVKKQDLKDAIVAILAGKGPPALQEPSMGCSIKWK